MDPSHPSINCWHKDNNPQQAKKRSSAMNKNNISAITCQSTCTRHKNIALLWSIYWQETVIKGKESIKIKSEYRA
jgi:hypothetical protein